MKSKIPYLISFILVFLGLFLSYFFKSPYYLIIPALSLIAFFMAKERGAFPLYSVFIISIVNVFVYFGDVKLKLFNDFEIIKVLISIGVFNLLTLILFWVLSNRLDKVEDEPYQEILDKFQKEQASLVEEKSKVNEQLKEYKLEYSQKLAVLRKFVETSYKNNEGFDKELVTIFKNVLKLDSFIFFKFSKQKNSFLKVYDQNVELSEIKKSKFLKWVIEHAVDFPASVKILSRDSMKTNPAFSNILKDKYPIPVLFIPIKNMSRLHGFVMVYNMEAKADNEYRAFASLLSELLSMMASKGVI